jgi:DNA repair exonuclease SbcCD nuclease subunit
MIKSSKIGCFSDVHIGLYQDSSAWHNISLNFAEWASKKYLDAGINDIIILGDVFHNRTEISVSTLDVAKKFFDYFKDFNVYILAGNHDSFYKDNSKVNSISIFDGWNNIKIVDKEPLLLKIGNKQTLLVPWGTEYENISNCDIIFGHFEIISFYMNSYKVCDHGFSSENLFKKAKIIMSGHFHKKDHRTYDGGEIIYLGSPYQQNYGDLSDERGIYTYDVDENKITFIQNNISPTHTKISIKKILSGEINSDYLKQNVTKNHISLVIDTKIDDEKVILLKGKLQNLQPETFRIEYLDTKCLDTLNSNLNDIESVDLMKDIENYVMSLDITDKKDVVSYIKDIYNNLTS